MVKEYGATRLVDDGAVWVADGPAQRPGHAGPLENQRLAVKDLFDMTGYVTGAGNPDWRRTHSPARATASAVQALLDAGAAFVGKTLTDEIAYSLNGINVHYGTPRNPRAPQRLPGGSSSGSAVAVARGEADIGLGTDTGGSIRIPASYNGLFGLRPSWGIIPVDHTVPLAPRFDTVGWLCRDAHLLARVGKVLLPEQRMSCPDELVMLVPEGMENGSFQLLQTRFAQLGMKASVQCLDSAVMQRASRAFRVLQGRDIHRTHGQWIDARQPRFAEDIAARLDWCRTLSAADEDSAEDEARTVVERLVQWSDHGCRLLCLPSAPGASPLLTMSGEPLARYRECLMGMTALAGLWGAPALAMPWLEDQGAPWGISVIAAPGGDRMLLDCAVRWNV